MTELPRLRPDPPPAIAPRDEVLDMCRLFQWQLPGRVVNVAYFRRQLREA